MRDWGDDPGRRGSVEIRCVAEFETKEERGCGWTGVTRVLTHMGATDWEITQCPDCGGDVDLVR